MTVEREGVAAYTDHRFEEYRWDLWENPDMVLVELGKAFPQKAFGSP